MKKAIRLSFSALAILIFGAISSAQAKPNFSGEWKFDAAKSDFGPMPVPAVFTRAITHTDPKLHIVTTQSGPQGERTTESDYQTDGKEIVHKVGDREVKSTAAWEGDTLGITTKIDVEGGQVVMQEKWTLSEDGKTLTSLLHANTPQGELEIKVVMNKNNP
ncbi:MAG: hypothetical protein ACRD9L_09530 [Bryobacteraceae bacterium]